MTRFGYVIITVLAAELFAALFVAVAIIDPRPRLLWNASASAPLGLYRIAQDHRPPVGALVAATPPVLLGRWMAGRGYLPGGLPLLKYVAARAGQQVCRRGAVVRIDGRQAALALSADRMGRPLPVWRGCRVLKSGEIFLLNRTVPDSLDGRYFGPLPTSVLLGRAIPILTRKTPKASLTWQGGVS